MTPARGGSERLLTSSLRAAALLLATAALGASLLLAVTVPYRQWDALAYGKWSRLIAETGAFHFADGSDQFYHRPLFYVLQGGLWQLVGFHEPAGRLLSLVFAVVLVAALVPLARAVLPSPFSPALAVLAMLAVPEFAHQAFAGMTDVPAAAAVAVTASLLWRRRPVPFGPLLLGLAAATAALTKPPALLVLVALGAGHLLGPRAELRARLVQGIVPLTLGTVLALLYHALQARHLAMPLPDYLGAGVTHAFYTDLAAEIRLDVLLGGQWLGPHLLVLVLFGTLYAVTRTAGAPHAPAAGGGAVTAIALAVAGPALAGVDGPLASPRSALVFALLSALAAVAVLCPPALAPSRLALARLTLWALPAFVVWVWAAPFELRLLAHAWPALILLAAAGAATGLHGALRLHVAAAAVPAAALVLLATANLAALDGLGRDGWQRWADLGPEGWRDREAMRELALGSFARRLATVEGIIGAEGRVFSSDGRFAFYFPRRSSGGYPSSCEAVAGHEAFVLLTDPASTAFLEEYVGLPASPDFWAACPGPHLIEVERTDDYAVFRVSDRTAEPYAGYYRAAAAEPLGRAEGAEVERWDFTAGIPEGWAALEGVRTAAQAGATSVRTTTSPLGYQVLTEPFELPPGRYVALFEGEIVDGGLILGVLEVDREEWIEQRTYWSGQELGRLAAATPFTLPRRTRVRVVLSNWAPEEFSSAWRLEAVELRRRP